MIPQILTVSGNYFSFTHPEQSTYTIEDIAHALSNITRFTGHIRQFYSVAQHSVLVSENVPQEHALAALLHDASEAFCGDIATPLKHLLPEYKVIEQRVEKAIFDKFGLPFPMHPCIKVADLTLLATEKRDLMPLSDEWEIIKGVPRLPYSIWPVTPPMAKKMFLDRYKELT